MKFKRIVVPALCVAVVVGLLYGKTFLFRPSPTPMEPPAAAPASEDVITIHYHERVPYYVTGPNGAVSGLCADPTRLAFETAGIPCRWQKTPAKRQLDILKENRRRECILGWFKNPERQTYARFSLPIFQGRPLIAIARSDNRRIESGEKLESTLSSPQLVLLTKDGYSYGQFVDEMLARFQPKHLVSTSEDIGMLQMVHAGRADYFFVSGEVATGLIASSGLPETDFQLIRFSDMPEAEKRYILFSKKVEDRVVEKIDTALRRLARGETGKSAETAGAPE